jgi:hypothetical protein
VTINQFSRRSDSLLNSATLVGLRTEEIWVAEHIALLGDSIFDNASQSHPRRRLCCSSNGESPSSNWATAPL